MNADKRLLRNDLSRRLSTLSSEDVQVFSSRVTANLKDVISWRHDMVIHTYIPNPKWQEVNVAPFMLWLEHEYPELKVVSSLAEYNAEIPTEPFDIILVPLLGFDKECNRLGRGAGWYDRFLAAQSDALKVGVAFELLICDEIPTENHDIPLDIIVTEQAVYTRKNSV